MSRFSVGDVLSGMVNLGSSGKQTPSWWAWLMGAISGSSYPKADPAGLLAGAGALRRAAGFVNDRALAVERAMVGAGVVMPGAGAMMASTLAGVGANARDGARTLDEGATALEEQAREVDRAQLMLGFTAAITLWTVAQLAWAIAATGGTSAALVPAVMAGGRRSVNEIVAELLGAMRSGALFGLGQDAFVQGIEAAKYRQGLDATSLLISAVGGLAGGIGDVVGRGLGDRLIGPDLLRKTAGGALGGAIGGEAGMVISTAWQGGGWDPTAFGLAAAAGAGTGAIGGAAHHFHQARHQSASPLQATPETPAPHTEKTPGQEPHPDRPEKTPTPTQDQGQGPGQGPEPERARGHQAGEPAPEPAPVPDPTPQRVAGPVVAHKPGGVSHEALAAQPADTGGAHDRADRQELRIPTAGSGHPTDTGAGAVAGHAHPGRDQLPPHGAPAPTAPAPAPTEHHTTTRLEPTAHHPTTPTPAHQPEPTAHTPTRPGTDTTTPQHPTDRPTPQPDTPQHTTPDQQATTTNRNPAAGTAGGEASPSSTPSTHSPSYGRDDWRSREPNWPAAVAKAQAHPLVREVQDIAPARLDAWWQALPETHRQHLRVEVNTVLAPADRPAPAANTPEDAELVKLRAAFAGELALHRLTNHHTTTDGLLTHGRSRLAEHPATTDTATGTDGTGATTAKDVFLHAAGRQATAADRRAGHLPAGTPTRGERDTTHTPGHTPGEGSATGPSSHPTTTAAGSDADLARAGQPRTEPTAAPGAGLPIDQTATPAQRTDTPAQPQPQPQPEHEQPAATATVTVTVGGADAPTMAAGTTPAAPAGRTYRRGHPGNEPTWPGIVRTAQRRPLAKGVRELADEDVTAWWESLSPDHRVRLEVAANSTADFTPLPGESTEAHDLFKRRVALAGDLAARGVYDFERHTLTATVHDHLHTPAQPSAGTPEPTDAQRETFHRGASQLATAENRLRAGLPGAGPDGKRTRNAAPADETQPARKGAAAKPAPSTPRRLTPPAQPDHPHQTNTTTDTPRTPPSAAASRPTPATRTTPLPKPPSANPAPSPAGRVTRARAAGKNPNTTTDTPRTPPSAAAAKPAPSTPRRLTPPAQPDHPHQTNTTTDTPRTPPSAAASRPTPATRAPPRPKPPSANPAPSPAGRVTRARAAGKNPNTTTDTPRTPPSAAAAKPAPSTPRRLTPPAQPDHPRQTNTTTGGRFRTGPSVSPPPTTARKTTSGVKRQPAQSDALSPSTTGATAKRARPDTNPKTGHPAGTDTGTGHPDRGGAVIASALEKERVERALTEAARSLKESGLRSVHGGTLSELARYALPKGAGVKDLRRAARTALDMHAGAELSAQRLGLAHQVNVLLDTEPEAPWRDNAAPYAGFLEEHLLPVDAEHLEVLHRLHTLAGGDGAGTPGDSEDVQTRIDMLLTRTSPDLDQPGKAHRWALLTDALTAHRDGRPLTPDTLAGRDEEPPADAMDPTPDHSPHLPTHEARARAAAAAVHIMREQNLPFHDGVPHDLDPTVRALTDHYLHALTTVEAIPPRFRPTDPHAIAHHALTTHAHTLTTSTTHTHDHAPQTRTPTDRTPDNTTDTTAADTTAADTTAADTTAADAMAVDAMVVDAMVVDGVPPTTATGPHHDAIPSTSGTGTDPAPVGETRTPPDPRPVPGHPAARSDPPPSAVATDSDTTGSPDVPFTAPRGIDHLTGPAAFPVPHDDSSSDDSSSHRADADADAPVIEAPPGAREADKEIDPGSPAPAPAPAGGPTTPPDEPRYHCRVPEEFTVHSAATQISYNGLHIGIPEESRDAFANTKLTGRLLYDDDGKAYLSFTPPSNDSLESPASEDPLEWDLPTQTEGTCKPGTGARVLGLRIGAPPAPENAPQHFEWDVELHGPPGRRIAVYTHTNHAIRDSRPYDEPTDAYWARLARQAADTAPAPLSAHPATADGPTTPPDEPRYHCRVPEEFTVRSAATHINYNGLHIGIPEESRDAFANTKLTGRLLYDDDGKAYLSFTPPSNDSLESPASEDPLEWDLPTQTEGTCKPGTGAHVLGLKIGAPPAPENAPQHFEWNVELHGPPGRRIAVYTHPEYGIRDSRPYDEPPDAYQARLARQAADTALANKPRPAGTKTTTHPGDPGNHHPDGGDATRHEPTDTAPADQPGTGAGPAGLDAATVARLMTQAGLHLTPDTPQHQAAAHAIADHYRKSLQTLHDNPAGFPPGTDPHHLALTAAHAHAKDLAHAHTTDHAPQARTPADATPDNTTASYTTAVDAMVVDGVPPTTATGPHHDAIPSASGTGTDPAPVGETLTPPDPRPVPGHPAARSAPLPSAVATGRGTTGSPDVPFTAPPDIDHLTNPAAFPVPHDDDSSDDSSHHTDADADAPVIEAPPGAREADKEIDPGAPAPDRDEHVSPTGHRTLSPGGGAEPMEPDLPAPHRADEDDDSPLTEDGGHAAPRGAAADTDSRDHLPAEIPLPRRSARALGLGSGPSASAPGAHRAEDPTTTVPGTPKGSVFTRAYRGTRAGAAGHTPGPGDALTTPSARKSRKRPAPAPDPVPASAAGSRPSTLQPPDAKRRRTTGPTTTTTGAGAGAGTSHTAWPGRHPGLPTEVSQGQLYQVSLHFHDLPPEHPARAMGKDDGLEEDALTGITLGLRTGDWTFDHYTNTVDGPSSHTILKAWTTPAPDGHTFWNTLREDPQLHWLPDLSRTTDTTSTTTPGTETAARRPPSQRHHSTPPSDTATPAADTPHPLPTSRPRRSKRPTPAPATASTSTPKPPATTPQPRPTTERSRLTTSHTRTPHPNPAVHEAPRTNVGGSATPLPLPPPTPHPATTGGPTTPPHEPRYHCRVPKEFTVHSAATHINYDGLHIGIPEKSRDAFANTKLTGRLLYDDDGKAYLSFTPPSDDSTESPASDNSFKWDLPTQTEGTCKPGRNAVVLGLKIGAPPAPENAPQHFKWDVELHGPPGRRIAVYTHTNPKYDIRDSRPYDEPTDAYQARLARQAAHTAEAAEPGPAGTEPTTHPGNPGGHHTDGGDATRHEPTDTAPADQPGTDAGPVGLDAATVARLMTQAGLHLTPDTPQHQAAAHAIADHYRKSLQTLHDNPAGFPPDTDPHHLALTAAHAHAKDLARTLTSHPEPTHTHGEDPAAATATPPSAPHPATAGGPTTPPDEPRYHCRAPEEFTVHSSATHINYNGLHIGIPEKSRDAFANTKLTGLLLFDDDGKAYLSFTPPSDDSTESPASEDPLEWDLPTQTEGTCKPGRNAVVLGLRIGAPPAPENAPQHFEWDVELHGPPGRRIAVYTHTEYGIRDSRPYDEPPDAYWARLARQAADTALAPLSARPATAGGLTTPPDEPRYYCRVPKGEFTVRSAAAHINYDGLHIGIPEESRDAFANTKLTGRLLYDDDGKAYLSFTPPSNDSLESPASEDPLEWDLPTRTEGTCKPGKGAYVLGLRIGAPPAPENAPQHFEWDVELHGPPGRRIAVYTHPDHDIRDSRPYDEPTDAYRDRLARQAADTALANKPRPAGTKTTTHPGDPGGHHPGDGDATRHETTDTAPADQPGTGAGPAGLDAATVARLMTQAGLHLTPDTPQHQAAAHAIADHYRKSLQTLHDNPTGLPPGTDPHHLALTAAHDHAKDLAHAHTSHPEPTHTHGEDPAAATATPPPAPPPPAPHPATADGGPTTPPDEPRYYCRVPEEFTVHSGATKISYNGLVIGIPEESRDVFGGRELTGLLLFDDGKAYLSFTPLSDDSLESPASEDPLEWDLPTQTEGTCKPGRTAHVLGIGIGAPPAPKNAPQHFKWDVKLHGPPGQRIAVYTHTEYGIRDSRPYDEPPDAYWARLARQAADTASAPLSAHPATAGGPTTPPGEPRYHCRAPEEFTVHSSATKINYDGLHIGIPDESRDVFANTKLTGRLLFDDDGKAYLSFTPLSDDSLESPASEDPLEWDLPTQTEGTCKPGRTAHVLGIGIGAPPAPENAPQHFKWDVKLHGPPGRRIAVYTHTEYGIRDSRPYDEPTDAYRDRLARQAAHTALAAEPDTGSGTETTTHPGDPGNHHPDGGGATRHEPTDTAPADQPGTGAGPAGLDAATVARLMTQAG
ncbi:hypothetical protein AB0O11_34765, partial [Kitasatospora sp. NPDC093102]